MRETDLDLLWNLFATTGSIDAYLIYKELQRQNTEMGMAEAEEF